MTLIELAIVVLVLLGLFSVIFIGARGWQRGTERARCIMNIRQMQMSMRAFSALREYEPGTNLSLAQPPVNVLAEMVGPGSFVPQLPVCPGIGIYFFGGDVIPEIGQLYMQCSVGLSQRHRPRDFSTW
jgi:hypothetical protein